MIDMKNQDLEIAKQKLIEKGLSLVIVKNGKIVFKTKKQGITGFLNAIEKFPQQLNEASIADKIVGVAAAILCVYSKITSVFALTISEEGINLLKNNNLAYFYKNKVEHILNRNKTDICPFEKLALESETTKEAYLKIKSHATQMITKSPNTEC
jgi:hypothetical protein